MYTDNTMKFTVVLNKKHPVGMRMNALGHLSAGLSRRVADSIDLLEYHSPELGFTSLISRYPVIALSADNNNQLRRLWSAVLESSVAYNVFTTSMIGTSATEQLVATAASTTDDVDFVGVMLFGPADVLDPLTRKFSLVRS